MTQKWKEMTLKDFCSKRGMYENLNKKFISLFLALSFAFQLAVSGYAETQGNSTLVTNTYKANNGLLKG